MTELIKMRDELDLLMMSLTSIKAIDKCIEKRDFIEHRIYSR